MTWHSIQSLTKDKWIVQFESHCKDHELDHFFADYINLLTLSMNPIIIVFDMRKITMPSITQLTKQILFLQKMKSIHKQKLKHFNLLITTTIVQELVDWVFKITPPVVPYTIINDLK